MLSRTVWGPRRAACEGTLGRVAEPELSFAGLLRQLRAEAKLTQEELAEAAGISPRSVSDLERGVTRTTHKDTAVLLAGALSLPRSMRELFVAAARGKAGPAEVLAARQGKASGAFAAARALPRDIAAFTGRQSELAQLMGTLAATAAAGGAMVRIHAIDGMAGIGKTTFAVHAAHRLAGSFPDGQFFLPLHAHTPGHRPVGPADALASLLVIAGVGAGQIPHGLDARAARWRDQVAGKRILLLLDDAASHEQVWPLLPGTAGSLVLVTSRRRLAALHDAAVVSLGTFPPAEAATLLVRLAARPGLGARDAAVGEITRLCGYLPLAIGMLASQLRHHPARTAAELAAGLAATSDRLALMHAENLSVAAAFDLSYQNLTPAQQRLFRRLGLIPGPSLDAYAAAALDRTSLDQARRLLDELYDQHLIDEPASGRYRLHDLLREHARALAASDEVAESDAAVGRLLDYYLHTVLAAGQHIVTRGAPVGRPPSRRPPADSPDLSTLEQALTWLEAERANLHAAVEFAAGFGRARHAVQIPAAVGGFLRRDGRWDEAAALQTRALTAARSAGDRLGEAQALNELGLLAWLTGDYPAATGHLALAVALYGEADDRAGQAYALNHLGVVRVLTGHYSAALTSHQRALAIAQALGDRAAEAVALNYLGSAQRHTGDYAAATASLARALELYRRLGHQHGQAQALRDLGNLQQVTGDYPAATASHQQALQIARDLGARPGQAWALNDLGMVQQLTGDYPSAAASHQQALELFRDLGSRLGLAETQNNLGQLATRAASISHARRHHTQALAIARDIGVPLEQARALEGIGQSYLANSSPAQAAKHLERALKIYQRIGAPDARRVQETLRRHGITSITTQHQPAARSSEPTSHGG
jgi:tetratricopeptide (TPR) repeat protein/transcriptional regulator with XRE-family HTH domain